MSEFDMGKSLSWCKDFSMDIRRLMSCYSETFSLLDDYDHRRLKAEAPLPEKTSPLTSGEVTEILKALRERSADSSLTTEKNGGLDSALAQAFQELDGIDSCRGTANKAARLLYHVT